VHRGEPRRLVDPTVLVAAVFYGVLLQIALMATVFGLWLGLLLTLSIWRYADAVLAAVAQGHRDIPAAGIETMNPVGDWRLIAHFIAFLLSSPAQAMFRRSSYRPRRIAASFLGEW